MMKKDTKTPFFLKENNCVDGKHYYALVEAEIVKVYDKDNKEFFIVKDNSEVKARASVGAAESIITYSSDEYTNGVKVSVDDNTLDLLQGSTDDKFNQGNNRELRTSAFAVVTDDSPLYRRFNNVALGESATDACDILAFVESVRGEYLMDEWNKNLQDKVVNYAGIWNKDKANGKLFFHIDTAWVNRGAGNIKPQYLISAAHVDVPGTPGVPCTYAHNHYDNAGNKVDAAHCSHATPAHAGYHYGKYLVNFSDSAKVYDERKVANPYKLSTNSSVNSSYTRVGFVEGIRVADTLWILPAQYRSVANDKVNFATLQAYNDSVVAKGLPAIKNLLTEDVHKNYVWSFRYVHPEKANNVTEEGLENSFLFESNIWPNSATTVNESIAPTEKAAWLKIQNGCVVLTDDKSTFANAKTGGDGALVFNVENKENDQLATDNETITTSEVTVIAGNGNVQVVGAEGKKVVITNILGQTVANTVITSDNATIAAPQGVVVVAVEGEEAVKAIVK